MSMDPAQTNRQMQTQHPTLAGTVSTTAAFANTPAATAAAAAALVIWTDLDQSLPCMVLMHASYLSEYISLLLCQQSTARARFR